MKTNDLRRIVIIGPECTGKSELSALLADTYQTVWVKEYAREYLDQLDRPYGPDDLKLIAHGQTAHEDAMAMRANKVLICDTDLYVIKVWSNFKYGYCDPEILDMIARRRYDLYLLTYIDIPWVSDPLREHPDQREELYAIYLREMENQSVPFVEVKGNRQERRAIATKAIDSLLEHGLVYKG
ncbi:MAG TPA: ATP-binding protein [Chryseosolibacter sp.]|nr:ATP-binding protein [Chryseosolibacter sp.]